MSKSAMSLKNRIKNLSKKRNIKAQVLLQNYMFECFLERLSLSEYKDKFVLKGGMLIASIVGLDIRSTMDLDTTIRDLPLTEKSVYQAISDICALETQEGVIMNVRTIGFIRPDDIYGGYRVKINAIYDTMQTPFQIDVSTGDVITPQAVKYVFRGIFDEEKHIELWAYTIETVMAEKIETILRRNALSTRPRDFYDIYILSTTQTYDMTLLKKALKATAMHRGTTEEIADIPKLMKIIENSEDLKKMWDKYRKEFSYAADISYEQLIIVLKNFCYKL